MDEQIFRRVMWNVYKQIFMANTKHLRTHTLYIQVYIHIHMYTSVCSCNYNVQLHAPCRKSCMYPLNSETNLVYWNFDYFGIVWNYRESARKLPVDTWEENIVWLSTNNGSKCVGSFLRGMYIGPLHFYGACSR